MDIPVEAVDADQLPRDRGIQYEEVVRIVGSLYLDSQHLLITAEERYNSIVQELKETIFELEKKNEFLEEQLRKINEQRILGESNNSGQNQD